MLRNSFRVSRFVTSHGFYGVCPCKLHDYLNKTDFHDSSGRHRKTSASSKRLRSPKASRKHGVSLPQVGAHGQTKPKAKKPTEQELFQPVLDEPVQVDKDQVDVGEEIAGKLTKGDKTNVMRMFIMNSSIQLLASQHGLQGKMFETALQSFRQFCFKSAQLPVDMHIVFKDIAQNAGHVTDLFPFFLNHAKTVYPHLDCMEDLQKISDLTDPSQWYPLARSMQRKVIFHVGPTNSGKTYHALRRFMESESGVYCGPLRLLAMEVFDKCNAEKVPCDLITGETRRYANDDETPAPHVACTVEMMNVNQEHDVAVIDEIQMIGDIQRGWAWTRALLGVAAQEVHVCGEETAVDLVQNLLEFTGDTLEVRRYERLTSLTYLDEPVGSFDRIRPGDCIVCFSKKDIFKVYNILTGKRYKCSVIYGDLPPGTKIMQSRKFNDPNDPCSVLIATDAVGMGLNLAIKRVIFYSLIKRTLREDHTLALEYLSTSQAQQIAGRAGRFGTQYEHGEVTTFWSKDLPHLHKIVSQEKQPLAKAGMNPTAEMIEMFSYHLPRASLSNLIDIFVHVCKMDDLYFMCNLVQFKELAEIIEHVPLPLKTRYTLCSSPLKVKKGFAQVMFVKVATQMSKGFPLTYEWLCKALGAPFTIPRSVSELEQLEGAFDVVDIYLWLSYRYPDQFVDADEVRDLRVKLDAIIQAFLNRGKIAEIKRRKADIGGLIEEGSVEAPGSVDSEIDSHLIEDSPLQAYKPKPKPKKNIEMHEAFASATADIEDFRKTSDTKEKVVEHETAFGEKKYDLKNYWSKREVKDVTVDKEKDTLSNKVSHSEHSGQAGGFFSKKHEMYNDLAGSYKIEAMFQKKQEVPKTKFMIENEFIDDHTYVIEDKAYKITTPAEVAPQEKEVKQQLGVETNRTKNMETEKEADVDTAEKVTKVGMGKEELEQFKDLLSTMKKVRQKDKYPDAAKGNEPDEDVIEILENYVHIYPPKLPRWQQKYNFGSDSGLGLNERKNHSKREAIHGGESSVLDGNKRSATQGTNSGLNDKIHEMVKGGTGENVNSGQVDSRIYKVDDIHVEDKSEIKSERSHQESLTEKLVKEGILSKDMLEKLKAEWEKEKSNGSGRTNNEKGANGVKR